MGVPQSHFRHHAVNDAPVEIRETPPSGEGGPLAASRLAGHPPFFPLLLMFLTVLAMFHPGSAEAGRTVIAVQSIEAAPYDEAFSGFQAAIGKTATLNRIILSDAGPEAVQNALQPPPDLVYAIGSEALSGLRDTTFPVVYAMVLDKEPLPGRRRVTGVRMLVDPEQQLSLLLDALPRTRTIGLLYDPLRTGAVVDRIRNAAAPRGVRVDAREVWRTRSVPVVGMEVMENVDLFWMLPDLTVVTAETVEFLFLSAMESAAPVLSFSDKYADLGAVMAIGVDPFDIGCQAGETAVRILSGADADAVRPEYARKAVITINLKIARKLGITFAPEMLKQARVIESSETRSR